jgi:hypothetical protein
MHSHETVIKTVQSKLKIEMSEQISINFPNTKLNQNQFIHSEVVPYVWTDGRKFQHVLCRVMNMSKMLLSGGIF